MSQAASQAWAFYRDVAREHAVWTLSDEGGFPAPENADGVRAWPFWSSRSRVERIIKNVAAYSGFEPVSFTWDVFRDEIVRELEAEGMRVGVNWSGKRAVGYDLEPSSLVSSVDALIEDPSLGGERRSEGGGADVR